MSDFLSWAQAYAVAGWKVFPCLPGKKEPATPHGFKDASRNPEQIAAWWGAWPNANIAIATGPASGILVVDLDEKNGKSGIASWELLKHDSPTATVKTPSGGKHLYFALPAGLSLPCTQGKLGDGIDTRCQGGYVLTAPSIVDGRPYQWEADPETTPPAVLPDFVAEKTVGNLSGLVDSQAKPLGPADRPAAYQRAKLYLECLPDAISGQGGHAATLRAAAECFRFGLTDSEAWDLLSAFNVGKCRPEWTEKELRHKLKEGRKVVDREGRFGSKLDEGTIEPAKPTVTVEESEPAPVERSVFPIDVERETTGLLGELCRWTIATAFKRQPELILANSLAFLGAVFGRRVRTQTDLRTNLYCLGVGDSGCGKDHSRKAIKRLSEACDLTAELLGGEEFASDSAIEVAAFANPSLLFQLDEIGHMLSVVNSKFASSHQRNIVPTLMKFFSSASTKYIGKEYAGRVRQDIDQPNICLYGTTTPARLYGGLTTGEISDGFLNRMIVFQSGDPDPIETHAEFIDPPKSLVDGVRAWRSVRHSKCLNKVIPADIIQPTPEAKAIMRDFGDQCRKRRAECRDGSGLDSLWARASEHVSKVSLILACANGDPGRPRDIRVEPSQADFAVRLIRHLTTEFVEQVRECVTDSEFGRQVQRVRAVIAAAGRAGLTMNKITRKTQGMLPQTRRQAIDELLAGGSICCDTITTSGRAATILRLSRAA